MRTAGVEAERTTLEPTFQLGNERTCPRDPVLMLLSSQGSSILALSLDLNPLLREPKYTVKVCSLSLALVEQK
jgi:hypothetical protein